MTGKEHACRENKKERKKIYQAEPFHEKY